MNKSLVSIEVMSNIDMTAKAAEGHNCRLTVLANNPDSY